MRAAETRTTAMSSTMAVRRPRCCGMEAPPRDRGCAVLASRARRSQRPHAPTARLLLGLLLLRLCLRPLGGVSRGAPPRPVAAALRPLLVDCHVDLLHLLVQGRDVLRGRR